MELTAEQQDMAAGRMGPALQWALRQQLEVGTFFQAKRLVPVASCHAGAEIGITGEAGLDLLEFLAAQICVLPSCAHAAHLERPDLFNRVVCEFFSSR